MEDDLGKLITFDTFCDTCEKLKSLNTNEKSDYLRNYLDSCRRLCRDPNNADLYPVMRMLLPQSERQRKSYGIKEITFAKLYIRVLNLPKNGHDAMKLSNYKAPSSSSSAIADFADVAYWVLKSRCPTNSKKFTIAEVHTHLDNIASLHGNNASRATDDELTKLINGMSALQQKWLIRIILKDMKLGMGQAKIFNCFHADAAEYFDSTSSLQKVCSTLKNENVHLNEIEIETFSSCRPMLSERLDITKIQALIRKENIFFLEKKFDGERFQIHMKDGVFKYFSRNGFEYTENYGEKFDSQGMLTQYLKDVINKSTSSFIIDGEMMGWHKQKKLFSSKGINFDVKKLTPNSSFKPCFCAFDILMHNNVTLTNVPLHQRLKYLDDLFVNKEGVILHSERTRVHESAIILDALNVAIDNQDEGIVIKDINSLYKPNSRKAGWFKIKPEYTEGVMNELDFLIIGGYYAENKLHGIVGSVLLGVADSESKINNVPSVFHSCGRVKLSVTREELEEVCDKLEPHWNAVDKNKQLSSILWTKDKPDLWIEPQNSVIVQVKATELVKSTNFKTDYTVRFPRIEKIRYDKPWYDCLTLEEFNKLTQNAHGVEKLTKRNIIGDDIENNTEISPRKKMLMINVAPQFQPVQIKDLNEKSNLFSGKEFCVITGNDNFTKPDVELKILENGGSVVQNPGSNTFCIIAGNKNVRVMNIVKSQKYNVASVEWLLKTLSGEQITCGELLKWKPIDLIGITSDIAKQFSIDYDEYGDSFTEPATLESLKYSFKKMDEINMPIYLMTKEMLKLDNELFKGCSPFSFLRGCYVYFVQNENNDVFKQNIDFVKLSFQFYGGKCCDNINEETTHVVICDNNKEKINEIVNFCQTNNYTPIYAKIKWIENCINNKLLLELDDCELKF